MALSVVHVVRQYAPSVGGLETVVSHLADEQRRRLGYSVRVVTLDRIFVDRRHRLPAREIVDGISVERLPWSGSPRYPLCPSVLRALHGADLVHVHAVDFFYDFLSWTRWWHGKPLIASTHGGFFHTTFASRAKLLWFHTVTRLSSLGYRRIVADSDGDAETFSRIAKSRLSMIENGVDLGAYADAAARDNRPVLLYFGRWSANKGIPQLIDLLAAIRKRDPRWRLIVAGRPYDLTADDLLRRARVSGVTDAVEVHPSPDREALRALIGRASYFACLSSYEGFGVAAIEAMSAGLWPVLGAITPFRKLIDGSGCGLLIDGADFDTHASALLSAHAARDASAPQDRERLMRFAQRYDWPRVADRFAVEYAAALAGSRGANRPVTAP